jgi:thioredoxin reductase (NADPH)
LGDPVDHEVAIIGAGPVGIELAVCLKRAGVNYVQFDARQIGHTMSWYPRNTHFFSTTERLELAGVPIQNNHEQRITGEDYLAYLRSVVELYDLQVNTYEPVSALERRDGGFQITTHPLTGERGYRSRRVVIAVGDMERPNRLGIPGEDLPHVSHYFRDPHDYFRKRLLVVGGRNTAVEAALRCWRAGARVTISYRQAWFNEQMVKHWLLPDLQAQIEAGTIRYLPETMPVAITPTCVELARVQNGQRLSGPTMEYETDFVLLATGYHGDQSPLEMAGVELCGENRVPAYDPNTMETNIPGLYLAGTVAAGIQQRYTLFIENSHVHAGRITQAITGHWPEKLGTIPERNYELPVVKIQSN